MAITRTLVLLGFLSAVIPGGAVPARAGEEKGRWGRFRGPNGAGISTATTIPVTWTDKDYNWTVRLPGVSYASPVVWAGRIFVTSGDRGTARRTVFCLDAGSGKTLWQRHYKSTTFRYHRDNSYAAATPAVDAERLYVTWTTPKQVTLLALDHAGGEVWRRDLGPFVGLHGSGTSPIIVGDLVVLANDQEDLNVYGWLPKKMIGQPGKSFLIAVDRKTGKTRWQVPRRSTLAAYSTPCLRKGDGGPSELVFSSTAHGITAVDPTTGKVGWEVPKVFLDRCAGSPVCAGGLVIASYGRGSKGTRLVAVRPGSKKDNVLPKIVWDMKKKVPLVPTPLAIDGRLFCWSDDGTVTCLAVATGKQIWQQRLGAAFYGSPVCVNGRLYCISKTGEVFVVAAEDKFKLLGRVKLGEPSFATPAVCDGVMYLRTRSKLFSLGGKKVPR